MIQLLPALAFSAVVAQTVPPVVGAPAKDPRAVQILKILSERPYNRDLAARHPELFQQPATEEMKDNAGTVLYELDLQAFKESIRRGVGYDEKQGCFSDMNRFSSIRNALGNAHPKGDWAALVADLGVIVDHNLNKPWSFSQIESAANDLRRDIQALGTMHPALAFRLRELLYDRLQLFALTSYGGSKQEPNEDPKKDLEQANKELDKATASFRNNVYSLPLIRLQLTVCDAYYLEALESLRKEEAAASTGKKSRLPKTPKLPSR